MQTCMMLRVPYKWYLTKETASPCGPAGVIDVGLEVVAVAVEDEGMQSGLPLPEDSATYCLTVRR